MTKENKLQEEAVREFAKEPIETFEGVKVDPKDSEEERIIIEGFAIDMSLTEIAVTITKECLEDYVEQLVELYVGGTKVKEKCSDVSMMLETTLGYLDMAKHHNIDKHDKVVGELIAKAIHHCEVSQNMLKEVWWPSKPQPKEEDK